MLLKLPFLPEVAPQSIENIGWERLTGSTAQRLEQLQDLPRARDLLGPDSHICSFASDVLSNEITLNFFSRKRNRDDGTTFDTRKITLKELVDSSEYTLELSEELEYVLLHPTATGIVFVMHVSSAEKAAKHMLPWTGEPYVYVSLICTKTIRGSELMNNVKRLASVLGVNFILLSALGHVVFYYAKIGWAEAGHVVLAEPMPLVFPSAAELAAVQTLGPRVSKSAAWIAVVQCKREEYVSNWTMLDTSFHLTVGALSKINVSPAQLCDELRAFEPSLQSKSTACALAHSPDADLRGLNLPPGARKAALQSLPGAPRAFYGQPYEEVITNHEAHNLPADGDKLAEFNEWFGTSLRPEDVEPTADAVVAHHNRRWKLRHAHKFVKAKKCAPDADSIIKKLSDWGGGLDASGEDLVRSNMDAILADEPDPEWFTNVIRADADKFIFEDGCYDDVMLERDCIMDCPVTGQYLSGAFALAAARVTGHTLPDEPMPLFRECDQGREVFAESWLRYRRDFLHHSRFGMELFVPSKRDNIKNQLFLHRRLPGSELSDQKAWKLFGGNVNFDALADEVNHVSHELGFCLEQPARFLVVIEHREFNC